MSHIGRREQVGSEEIGLGWPLCFVGREAGRLKGRVSARKWSHFLDGGGGVGLGVGNRTPASPPPSIKSPRMLGNVLLRPPGSLASDLLSSQPARCVCGGGGIRELTSTKGKLCEVPVEHTLSGQGDC